MTPTKVLTLLALAIGMATAFIRHHTQRTAHRVTMQWKLAPVVERLHRDFAQFPRYHTVLAYPTLTPNIQGVDVTTIDIFGTRQTRTFVVEDTEEFLMLIGLALDELDYRVQHERRWTCAEQPLLDPTRCVNMDVNWRHT